MVSSVSVDHHIDVGFDLSEHRLNDMPFSPSILVADDGTRFTRQSCRPVGRAVVKDVDLRLREHALEPTHDLRNRHFLVVTRDQYRDNRVRKPHNVLPGFI